MKEEKEVKNRLKETPETLHLRNIIKKLQEITDNSRITIQQNQWTIKALKASLKKSLLEANKK
jgi:hypothetical protein